MDNTTPNGGALPPLLSPAAWRLRCAGWVQGFEKYLRLAQDCKNSLRAMLQKIDSGCMAAGKE